MLVEFLGSNATGEWIRQAIWIEVEWGEALVEREAGETEKSGEEFDSVYGLFVVDE